MIWQRYLTWRFLSKHKRACKKLQRDVERRKQSFECEQFRRRRAAALKHTRGIA